MCYLMPRGYFLRQKLVEPHFQRPVSRLDPAAIVSPQQPSRYHAPSDACCNSLVLFILLPPQTVCDTSSTTRTHRIHGARRSQDVISFTECHSVQENHPRADHYRCPASTCASIASQYSGALGSDRRRYFVNLRESFCAISVGPCTEQTMHLSYASHISHDFPPRVRIWRNTGRRRCPCGGRNSCRTVDKPAACENQIVDRPVGAWENGMASI